MNDKPKLNESKLTPEQRDKLEVYARAEAQLQTINDIASMTQEVVNILDDQKNDKKVDNLGVLLTDIRESLTAMKDKEDPETPDFSKPTVDAVKELQAELTKAINKIDTKPQVKIDAPNVKVDAPDLSGVEKAVKEIPKAFNKAIQQIPKPEKPDNTELLKAWQGISNQLESLDKATRMKPMPGTMKVTNPDGSSIGSLAGSTYYQSFNDTTTDTNLVYLGKAVVGSDATDAAWQIKRYNKSAGTMTFADDITTFTKTWDNRTSYEY